MWVRLTDNRGESLHNKQLCSAAFFELEEV